MNKLGGLAAVAITAVAAGLAGCGGSQPAPATTSAAAGVPSTTSTTTSAPPSASAGDIAACRGYLRLAPQANENLKTIGQVPLFLTVHLFEELGNNLEQGTQTAQAPELTSSLKDTVAAVRSALATTQAYRDGDTLDLRADEAAIYAASDKVAAYCITNDSGNYTAIGSAS